MKNHRCVLPPAEDLAGGIVVVCRECGWRWKLNPIVRLWFREAPLMKEAGTDV